jgi:hypothetical protein
VRREEFDPAIGERGRQQGGQLAVLVIAHSAVGPFLVDHHSDRRIGPRRRGDVGDMPQRVHEFIRKVNAHNTSHFAAIDGDEHEGFLRHEAEHCGQGRDQNAGPVEVKVGRLRCRHTRQPSKRRRRIRPASAISRAWDEFATGDELRAADAAHLEHRVGEQRVQRSGCPGRRQAWFPLSPRGQVGADAHVADLWPASASASTPMTGP